MKTISRKMSSLFSSEIPSSPIITFDDFVDERIQILQRSINEFEELLKRLDNVSKHMDNVLEQTKQKKTVRFIIEEDKRWFAKNQPPTFLYYNQEDVPLPIITPNDYDFSTLFYSRK